MHFDYLYLIRDSAYIKKEIKGQLLKRAEAVCTQRVTPDMGGEEKKNVLFVPSDGRPAVAIGLAAPRRLSFAHASLREADGT